MRIVPAVFTSLGLAVLGTASAADPLPLAPEAHQPTIARSSGAQVGLGRPAGARSVPALGRPVIVRAQNAEPGAEVSVRSALYDDPAKGTAPKTDKKVEAKKPENVPATTDKKPETLPPITTGVDLNCDPCSNPRGAGGSFYGSAEFLLWRLRDSQTPPLVTTSAVTPPPPIAPPFPGAIGTPGTSILFGGEIDHGWRPGARFTLGYWFDPCQTLGVEASIFALEHRAVTYQAGSDGLPALFRPFFSFSPTSAQPFIGESVELVAYPNALAGTVVASLDTRLWGAEANLRKSLCYGTTARCSNFTVDLLGGFRYLSLDETLQIDEYLAVTNQPNGGPPIGTRFVLHDEFRTDNRFYGGQIGAQGELRRGNVFLEVKAKLALGVTHQEVSIDGATVVTPPTGPIAVRQGGLLTQPTNIGERDRNVFSIVPEIGVNLGYQVSQNARVFGGYSLLYWTNVVRPGDEVDRVVNVTQLPSSPVPFSGPARPAFSWNDTNFWAQGFNLGVEMRY
jgi:hypothetical protein